MGDPVATLAFARPRVSPYSSDSSRSDFSCPSLPFPFLSRRKRPESGMSTAVPTVTQMTPTGVKEKNLSGS